MNFAGLPNLPAFDVKLHFCFYLYILLSKLP